MGRNAAALREQMRLDDVVREFEGIFGRETIERLADESMAKLLETASVYSFLPLLATRFTRERLQALAQAEGLEKKFRPEILFVCVHNAGRSQMAALLASELSAGRVHVRSAGSAPSERVDPAVAEAMSEIGLDLADAFPKPLTDEVVRAADVVITMGCGDACPLYPGKRYLDWDVADPAGQPLAAVREVRDDIRDRVSAATSWDWPQFRLDSSRHRGISGARRQAHDGTLPRAKSASIPSGLDQQGTEERHRARSPARGGAWQDGRVLNPVYVPAAEPSAWRSLVARPDLHWKPGHSAYELAHAWAREGWPHEVVGALHAAGPALAGLEMLLALPEHRVPLPGGGHPAQTDLMVYAHNLGGALVVLAIEGKVAEPLGPLVGEWRVDASGARAARLHALRRTLGLDDGPPLDALRYQLLPRAASALIEAGRFGASHAVLLVHSFDPQDPGLADLGAFAHALGCESPPLPGEVCRAAPRVGPVLWLGWARGAPAPAA